MPSLPFLSFITLTPIPSSPFQKTPTCTQTPPRPRIPISPSTPKPTPKIPSTDPVPIPPSPPSIPPSISLLLLNAATIIWSTQHTLIKLSILQTPPPTLTFSRFFLATLLSLPFLPRTILAWRYSIEQGIYLFLGYAAQSIALTSTTASRSAFLLYLNVKLVPLFSYLFYKRIPSSITILSAFLALVGTMLLSWDNTSPTIGDLWSIFAAASSAMFILRLEKASKIAPASQISAGAVATVAMLSAFWVGGSGNIVWPDSTLGWGVVLYLGVVATALGNYLQTLAQGGVSAERAAVVYALDPVYGAGIAYLVLGEQLGGWGVLGGGLVALAAVWSGVNEIQTNDESGGGLSEEDALGEG